MLWSVASNAIRGSKNVRARVSQAESQFRLAGAHGLPTSASTRTVILPPCTGASDVVGGVDALLLALPPAAVVLVPPPAVVFVLELLSPPQAAAINPNETTRPATSLPDRPIRS